MQTLLIHDPLGRDALFRIIAGVSLDELNVSAMQVSDVCIGRGGRVPVPAMIAARGSTIEGVVVTDLPKDVQSRLEYFAGACGWDLAEVRSEPNSQAGSVVGMFEAESSECRTFDADRWSKDIEPLMLEAAREIMSHIGRFSALELRPRLPMILARAAARLTAGQGVPIDVRNGIRSSEIIVQDTRVTHADFFVTRQYDLRHPRFDGSLTPSLKREVFVATDAAIVLPYDPVNDRVLLVEQFRMGPYGRGDIHPWMLEPVAGRVDALETPEECARRECEEEAGLALHRLEHIASHYCSPGCSTEYFHCYLGLCDLPELYEGAGGLASEEEDIRTHILSFDDAVRLVTTGEADNGPLVLCLLWLQRERNRLRGLA